ncbi:MAG: hypothetical protein RR332_01310, partial [Clostridiales bacterium]
MEIANLSPFLGTEILTKQLSHAYLFCGEAGFAQAMALSAALLCPHTKAGRACGVCPICLRFAAGTHSDFYLIEPETNGHRIENMRHLHTLAALSAIESALKIFVIKDAANMGEPAANSLLKLLEEPPENTVFILIAESADSLLPTIISRCQCFSFDDGER